MIISIINKMVLCFIQILLLSITGTLLFWLYLLLRKLIGKYTKKTYLYYMWIFVLISFLIPISFRSFQNIIPKIILNKKESFVMQEESYPFVLPKETEKQIQKKEQFILTQEILKEKEIKLQKKNTKMVFTLFLIVLSFVWIIGTFVFFIKQVWIYKKFNKELKNAEILSTNLVMLKQDSTDIKISKDYAKTVYTIAARESKQLKLNRIPEILFHNNISSPLLTGIIYQRIYLPAEEVSQIELENILYHELIHAKRQDLIYGLFLDFIQILHWFNPFVWKMISFIQEDREFSCDERVTSCMDKEQKKTYCKTILMNISRAKNKKLIPTVTFSKNKYLVERRIGEIMKKKNYKKGIAILFGIILFVSGCSFSHKAFTQQSKTKETVAENISVALNAVKEEDTRKIDTISKKSNSFSKNFSSIRKIEVHSYLSNVELKQGAQFFVEAFNTSPDFSVTEQDGVLLIKGNTDTNQFNNWNWTNKSSEEEESIIIYIPENSLLEEVYLDISGCSIDTLQTKSFQLDSGSYPVSILNLNSKKTNIDSGSGMVSIQDSNLGDTDIDSGSGMVDISSSNIKDFFLDSGSGIVSMESKIEGDIELNTGSGIVEMQIEGNRSDYFIHSYEEKNVLINGDVYFKNNQQKSAKYNIDINSGSGKVAINFTGFNTKKETTTENTKNEFSPKKTTKDYTKELSLNYPAVEKDKQQYLDISDEKLIKQESYSVDKIDTLYLSFANNHVFLYSTDEDKITIMQSYPKNPQKQQIYKNGRHISTKTVDIWDLEEKEKFQAVQKNNSFFLSTEPSSFNGDYKNGVKNAPTHISIFIPKEAKLNFDIDISLGDITFEHPLLANNIDLYASLGDVRIRDNIMAQQISFKLNLGDIFIEKDISSDIFKINNSLGDCSISSNLYCNTIGIEINLGDCILKKDINCNKIDLILSLGDFYYKKINANIKNIPNMYY